MYVRVPKETRRGCQIPQNWSWGHLGATMWVLQRKLTEHPNCWAISCMAVLMCEAGWVQETNAQEIYSPLVRHLLSLEKRSLMAQAALECLSFLFLPQCWDYECVLPCPAEILLCFAIRNNKMDSLVITILSSLGLPREESIGSVKGEM